MHYYIDGYNLLFRTVQSSEDLAKARQQIIEELNAKAEALDLNVTLVFDSQYQQSESSRSHYAHIEILFSAHGETADELILEEIKSERHLYKKTVVTSDKKLAWFARRSSAKTESIEQFLEWLNKRYKNKQRQKKNPSSPSSDKKAPQQKPPKKPPSVAKVEECADYYLEQFQERYETVEKFAPKPKIKIKPREDDTSKARLKKGSNKMGISDFQRWHNAFERELQDEDNSL